MDSIIVGLIVLGAVIFCIRGFVRIYRGEGGCSCADGCSCSSVKSCDKPFPIIDKK